MTFRTANIDWVSLISSHDLMTNESLGALDIGLNNGGFVSGGFARMLAVAILTDIHLLSKKNCDLWKEIKDNTRLCQNSIDAFIKTRFYHNDNGIPGKGRYLLSHVCDIDVWFNSEQNAIDASRQLIHSRDVVCNLPTLGGFGHEFIVGKNIFQFIKKLTGTAEEVIDSFDIKNAKVYFDRDGIHWSDEWAILEENRMLGIDDFSKPSILWRIKKWSSKEYNFGYAKFRQGDDKKYIDALIRIAKMTENHELYRWGLEVKIEELSKINDRICYSLPDESMLKASSSIFNNDYASLIASITYEENKQCNEMRRDPF